MVIAFSVTPGVPAQQPSPAAGPWSGQAQCVVVGKWTDYHDEQTHTWRLTGDVPTPAARGSAQVYYTWPATWSVQGNGRKTWPSREPGGREQTERWMAAHEMTMSLRITEVGAGTGRLRIGTEGQRGAPLGSLRVTEVSGRTRDQSVQQWAFPAIEDSASNTTISGTSTRTYPEGFGVGPGQPPKAITTATCTWSFTRGSSGQISRNSPRDIAPMTGGRGIGSPQTAGTPGGAGGNAAGAGSAAGAAGGGAGAMPNVAPNSPAGGGSSSAGAGAAAAGSAGAAAQSGNSGSGGGGPGTTTGGTEVRERMPIAGAVAAGSSAATPPIATQQLPASSASTASPSTTGQPRAARASGESATSPEPSPAPFAGTGGGDGVPLTGGVACAAGPDVQTTVTPTSVTFTWRSLAGATGYLVSDRNGNTLASTPSSQLTYTHTAPHNYSYSYSYGITALLANGGCVTTNVTFTPARPLTPQVTARVTAGTPTGRVTLTWGDQADQPSFYYVTGSGIPQSGAQVTASRSGQSYEVSQLPPGTHSWLVVPLWRVADETIGDASLGAHVTATVLSNRGPRTIELAGFTGAGTWVVVSPRTIQISGFTARGTLVVVAPRMITLGGWTGTGSTTAVQGVIVP
jgi:hypothetical protein